MIELNKVLITRWAFYTSDDWDYVTKNWQPEVGVLINDLLREEEKNPGAIAEFLNICQAKVEPNNDWNKLYHIFSLTQPCLERIVSSYRRTHAEVDFDQVS